MGGHLRPPMWWSMCQDVDQLLTVQSCPWSHLTYRGSSRFSSSGGTLGSRQDIWDRTAREQLALVSLAALAWHY